MRRLGRGALRVCLYPLAGVVLSLLASLLVPAAALWILWERWTTRRTLLQLVARQGVTP